MLKIRSTVLLLATLGVIANPQSRSDGLSDCTWGSQSWLQPPFKAASRPTSEMVLGLQSLDFSQQNKATLTAAARMHI